MTGRAARQAGFLGWMAGRAAREAGFLGQQAALGKELPPPSFYQEGLEQRAGVGKPAVSKNVTMS